MHHPINPDSGHSYSSTPKGASQFIPECSTLIPEAATADDTTDKPNEYETISPSENYSVPHEAKTVEEAYDYAPELSKNDDEYDYENPYWAPANKRTELLRQFRKLRIQSVAQKELE